MADRSHVHPTGARTQVRRSRQVGAAEPHSDAASACSHAQRCADHSSVATARRVSNRHESRGFLATLIGIELSPSACRIVEIDGRSAWRVSPAETRVRSCTVLPATGPATQAHFASLRGRTAAVVVWGAESTHRQVMVTDGSYEAMRVEGGGGAGGRRPAACRAPGPTSRRRHAEPADPRRRPVVVALASGPALSAALQPLIDAGIRVRTVMTPAMALGSLARLRRVGHGIRAPRKRTSRLKRRRRASPSCGVAR